MSSQRAVRELLGRLLRREGYICSCAADGDEAFECIARARPLVAVLDMREGVDDDLLFLGLLRKRYPELGAIVLLPGRSLVVHGRSEHVLEHHVGVRGPNLPSVDQLRLAIDWIATQTMLATWKPPAGSA
jgi:CheY-like chemotaxis protein